MGKNLSFVDIQHLYLRGGFGLPLEQAARLKGGNRASVVQAFMQASLKYDEIDLLEKGAFKNNITKELTDAQKKALRKEMRWKLKALNLEWLKKMATDPAQLREKMTFFWHDHFAAEVRQPYAMQNLNNLMRKHALGSFRTLLTEVSKHPVMLQYLNARQNRKASPNENFAREVMELFTLGTGQYSEKDIKEAARAFTGWNFTAEGEFVIRKRQHDTGTKIFRGQSGNFDGDDILRMILEDKQTARFISEKLYRYLVNPVANPKHVEEMATVFYDNDYDITALLAFVFLSDWFYDQSQHGVRIKSPTEYLAVMIRTLGLEFEEAEALVRIQKLLGQVLFEPPNVAGWPEGTAWIDSSTLSIRMLLPAMILIGAEGNISSKADLMDMDLDKKALKKLRKIKATTNWAALEKGLKKVKDDDLAEFLAWRLYQIPPNQINLDILHNSVDRSSRRRHLQTLLVQAMTLPEYQLC